LIFKIFFGIFKEKTVKYLQMKTSTDKSIFNYFYHWESETPDSLFLRQPFGDDFKDFTWRETGSQTRKVAAYLKSLNLKEKSNIAIISKNCAEWIIADVAIQMAGHISVPIYPTLTGVQINDIMKHAEVEVAFFGKFDDWSEIKPDISTAIKGISFPTYNPDSDHAQWNEILENTEGLKENFFPVMSDLYTIIYTSGTTGNPKGVMLTHQALAEVIYNTRDVTHVERRGAKFFSYLPLSHIAERNLIEAVGIISGGTIFFAENLDTFAKNLRDAEPTHFLAVPRIWTKFQLGILSKLPQKKLDFLLKIPIVSGFITKKIQKGLGLHKTWITVTGAAPMPSSLIQWFRKIGIVIQEAYGMTENLGATCVMPRDNIKDGFVGKINPGLEVKIDSQTGEIMTRSSWNMVGYFKEPKMTADTIDTEGWLHTGDVGELDADNYLKITGRVKEMYKTSKGEYVAPAQIEMAMAENQLIEQVCVVGEHLPQPIALVVMSAMSAQMDKEAMIQNFKNQLETLNPILKAYERIHRVIILKEPWTVENNKLTPTLKLKRAIIEKEFHSRIEPWYESKDVVVFEV
jgi:long-chain acyl-CoA synthetase